MFSLLWWLGPWMEQSKSPPNIKCTKIPVSNGMFDLFVYQPPTKAKGAIYVIPGLHYEGPEDVRLDRFARVLAHSGMVVGVPALPTMKGLIMTPDVWTENTLAFEAFLEQNLPKKPGVFSISAASIVAFHLAAHPILGKNIRELLTFGGYIDWNQALVFSMNGIIDKDIQVPIDPLGIPVIFLHVLPQIKDIENIAMFRKELLVFVERTWEKEEMQSKTAYEPVAYELSQNLMPADRDLFLQACVVKEGAKEIITSILAKENADWSWFEPHPWIEQIKTQVTVAHGKDDGVIPYTQAQELWNIVPQTQKGKIHVTGLYHHTGPISLRRMMGLLIELPVELWNSIGLVKSIARTGGIL